MHDVMSVSVGQGIGDVTRNRHGVRDWKPSLAHEPVAKGFPLDVRHRIEEQTVCDAGIEEREDMRVSQPSGNLDFA